MICVAIVTAVGEVRPDFSEVACFDRLIAHHTDGFRAGRPAIHQYELHVASPNAKQNSVADGWLTASAVRRLGIEAAIYGRLPGGF
jgi:hypothetical protein